MIPAPCYVPILWGLTSVNSLALGTVGVGVVTFELLLKTFGINVWTPQVDGFDGWRDGVQVM